MCRPNTGRQRRLACCGGGQGGRRRPNGQQLAAERAKMLRANVDAQIHKQRAPVGGRQSVARRRGVLAAQLARCSADENLLRGAGVEHPVVALAGVVVMPGHLDETLVQAQIVSDGVLPALLVVPVEGIVAHDVLVDAVECEPLVGGRLDGHHNERVVTIGWLRVFRSLSFGAHAVRLLLARLVALLVGAGQRRHLELSRLLVGLLLWLWLWLWLFLWLSLSLLLAADVRRALSFVHLVIVVQRHSGVVRYHVCFLLCWCALLLVRFENLPVRSFATELEDCSLARPAAGGESRTWRVSTNK